ncbi:MAG: hypothetical protein Q4E33_00285 [Erysipelotrichaceae bacterium]|nr:hypothetical protein [Erysipelotrichaceae bacterium]
MQILGVSVNTQAGEGTGLIALLILAIIGIAYYYLKPSKELKETTEVVEETKTEVVPLDINDEDATVASLVAAIECRNEFKKNVQVISVRRIG